VQTEQTKSILIGGKWRDGNTLREVVNPATREVVSRQAEVSEDEVREAIDTASQALDGWRRTSAFERSEILGRIAALLLERAEDIGKTLTLESGKLLTEAVGEVRFAADYFSWFAGEARRLEQLMTVDGRMSGS
jgi:succinate-semialdehyde dehydrogenase/glutarate-semialdehyde dehydrogenase